MSKTPQKIGAIYSRTSSDDGDILRTVGDTHRTSHKASIEQQISMCRELAERHNYRIPDDFIFFDKDVSGRTYPRGCELATQDLAFVKYFNKHIRRQSKRSRTGLANLLRVLPEVDVILQRDQYRLMRPVLHSHLDSYIWQQLTDNNVIVHSYSEGVMSPDDYTQQLMSSIRFITADETKQKEIEASRRTLAQRKDEGRVASCPTCYGFRFAGYQSVEPVKDQLRVVRDIFSRFLQGHSIYSICRYLNESKIPTAKGKNWGRKQVFAILKRPAYAGLQYVSDGSKVIPSHVYDRNRYDKFMISELDYYRAQDKLKQNATLPLESDNLKQKRIEQFNAEKPERGGGRIGRQVGGRIHALTGIVTCGTCGFHLRTHKSGYISKDKYIPSYYYECPSSHVRTDSPACKKTLIRETISLQSPEEQPIRHNGLGLIEGLFPLAFTGFIKQYGDREEIHKLDTHIHEISLELQNKKKTEYTLLEKLTANKISDKQFDDLISIHRKDREKLELVLSTFQKKREDMQRKTVTIPKEHFLDPKKVDQGLMSDLCHAVFKEIKVYGDRVHVFLTHGGDFSIERIRVRTTRSLPYWRARINTKEITRDSKLGIAYFYKSTRMGRYDPLNVIYSDDTIEVVTLGINDFHDGRKRTFLSQVLEEALGPPPQEVREIEFSSTAFFTKTPGISTDSIREIPKDMPIVDLTNGGHVGHDHPKP